MKLSVRRFESGDGDEEISFEKGNFRKITLAGVTIGRASYEPGWKWSEHVGPIAGTQTCEVEHVGMVLAGRAAIRMDDGTEVIVGPGDLFSVPAGHDSWVVGEDPYVSLHFLGAQSYAKKADER
jgi:mannose-6-phosphate isomerase-like protein (cupin superfamily)